MTKKSGRWSEEGPEDPEEDEVVDAEIGDVELRVGDRYGVGAQEPPRLGGCVRPYR